MRLFFLLMLLIAFSSFVSAIPEIYNLEGSLFQESNITIVGSDFGVKSPVEPLIWDDFEDGLDFIGSNIVDVNSKWLACHNGQFYDDSWSHSGFVSVRKDPRGFYSIYPANAEFTETLYMTAWLKTENWEANSLDFPYGTSVKFFRMNNNQFGSPSCYNGPLDHDFGHDTISRGENISEEESFGLYLEQSADNEGTLGRRWYPYYTPWYYNSEPVRVEYFASLNTPGVEDGYAYSHHIGWGYSEHLSLMQREENSTLQLNIPLFQLAAANVEEILNLEAWGDDYYADITQARIELANCENFLSCSHREIQIPHTIWNDNEIQFTVNLGSFTQDEINASLFLFVVDEDGNVSDGFEVDFSGNYSAYDLDYDNFVDISDLQILAEFFGTSDHDLNSDGVVNIIDLIILISNFS